MKKVEGIKRIKDSSSKKKITNNSNKFIENNKEDYKTKNNITKKKEKEIDIISKKEDNKTKDNNNTKKDKDIINKKEDYKSKNNINKINDKDKGKDIINKSLNLGDESDLKLENKYIDALKNDENIDNNKNEIKIQTNSVFNNNPKSTQSILTEHVFFHNDNNDKRLFSDNNQTKISNNLSSPITKENNNNSMLNKYNNENANDNNNNNINPNNINNNNNKTINNNITTNNDFANLIQYHSYLTSDLLSQRSTGMSPTNLNPKNQQTYKLLKEKETHLSNEINAIKQKKEMLTSCSFNGINKINVVESSIRQSELKKLKINENLLVDKLENIKNQILKLLQSEKKLNRAENIKEYLEKLKYENNTKTENYINYEQIAKIRQKQILDLEKSKERKNKELDMIEEEIQSKKNNFLNEQRLKELEIIRRRKREIDEQILKTKRNIQNKHFDPKDYLYNKLASQFEENENRKYTENKLQHKINLSKRQENIQVIKRRIIESKYELEKRIIQKTNDLHHLWRSRSLITSKYKSPILNKLNEIEKKQIQDEENKHIQKIVLFKEKEKYGKENIPLPLISEKLKEEREKRQMNFNNLQGKERVQCIKDELSSNKCKNKNYAIDEKLIKQSNKIIRKIKRVSKSQEKNSFNEDKKMKKSYSCGNMDELKEKKLKIRKPNEINYLEELRKEKEKKNSGKCKIYDWKKEIEKGGDKEKNMQLIKKQIEVIDEKYKRGKDLIKVKGGYLQNQELGDDISNMIINSIKGKLTLIENMNK